MRSINKVGSELSAEEGGAKRLHKRHQIILWSFGVALVFFVCATVILAILLAKQVQSNEKRPAEWPSASNSFEGSYRFAAVAADNAFCSEVGRNILIKGGNYIDAIIAVSICQEVMDPHNCGMGGGSFITLYNKKNKTCTIVDSREVAPKLATPDMFVNHTNASRFGWLAIAVPGHLSGIWKAHRMGAKLPWAQLLQPTIDLLRAGTPVSGAVADALHSQRKYIEAEPTLKVFINPNTNQVYKEGELLKRPQLLATLEKLALSSDPEQLFYRGEMAKELAEEFSKNGAIVGLDDLRDYQAQVRRSAIYVDLPRLGLTACGPPPPSSAAVLLGILNILDGYNISTDDLTSSQKESALMHRFIEAMKFAYASRLHLGDMDFVPKALEVAQNITSPNWSKYVRSLITERAHEHSYYEYGMGSSERSRDDRGTSHMNVVDQEGNVAALTMSINDYFGSKRRSEKTGIVWNDEMDDFSTPGSVNGFGFQPSDANYIRGGKRPQSSMSPTVFFHKDTGNPVLAVGAAGGSRIISAVSYIALRALYLNETVKHALDMPRLHNQFNQTDLTEYQDAFPETLIRLLTERGQKLAAGNPLEKTAATAIKVLPDGSIVANSDFRKAGGLPAGF